MMGLRTYYPKTWPLGVTEHLKLKEFEEKTDGWLNDHFAENRQEDYQKTIFVFDPDLKTCGWTCILVSLFVNYGEDSSPGDRGEDYSHS